MVIKVARVNSNIDLLVLSILNRHDEYTYEIIKTIKDISKGTIEIKEGTLYPIIYNLTKKEYISSYNIPHKNRIRVYYKIEPLGKRYLEVMRDQYRKNSQGVHAILDYGEGENVNE